MKLVQSIMTNNPCYKAGRTITVKGLMIHSIGCPQPDANVFLKNWNSESYTRACVHAFIDGNNGTVYQTLPWNYRGWHCGSGNNGSGNNTHIGVEMCEPACIKYTKGSAFTCSNLEEAQAVAKRTYQAAVELFAKLCKEYNLDPLKDGVILSHAEGYKRGISSNHGDPTHLWTQLKLDYTMDTFRKDIKELMVKYSSASTTTSTSQMYRVRKTWADAASQIGAYSSLENAKKACKEGYSVYDKDGKWVYASGSFKVKVTIKDLHIREKATADSTSKGYIDPGTYTIVETSGKWGFLKSTIGWIHLSYVERL